MSKRGIPQGRYTKEFRAGSSEAGDRGEDVGGTGGPAVIIADIDIGELGEGV